ncbi:antA/AntB antirepressor family protein [Spirosoma validum]|uniref:AntA/AntB antirepressor family protein n=1 Tax=Spirosoma validum TaxID=2771355 RepID=A0A927B1C1_9BACT|nr:antA/AntB antirepressor family protein [Spirosoma validum]MBD2753756.1 antA/AntB antirepressor family protein [Spirosoma validum]
MNELITISTGGQGSPVVSARELHSFFEVKTEFAKWSKRMFDYGFTEGQDYSQVIVKNDDNPNGGRPMTDYALTLDCAKEIAMIQRTEKGKQARQYFIDKEKQLNSLLAPAPPSTEQVLMQLVSQSQQILLTQGEMIAQLRADVDQIMTTGCKPVNPGRAGRQLSMPGLPRPRPSVGTSPLRQLIHTRVVEYCGFHDATTQETYTYLYKRLFDVYSINVYRLTRAGTESMLDALERYGHLDKVYGLVMAELSYSEE